jgi:hypothetical protein
MAFDPATFDLGHLFRDPDMFDTSESWAEEGFQILRASDNKITVASHKSVPGYLFKKYVTSGKREALDDQLENYEKRIEGARGLRKLIADKNLRHVVVPNKWIRELPREFGTRNHASHIMVVEQIDLLDGDESEREYGRIREDVLRDLCTALYAFRGLDSTAKNVPFTTDGRVAFIDTEHWNRHSDARKHRRFLKYLGEHLSSDRRKLAQKLWNSFEGGGDGKVAAEFDDEEDTSSSSSSSDSS